ncbi:hypothetical protein [Priestia megaterium]|uniref:hypothetical protein n=1 Tax=Priestia megaterium TaxID=1404 RepID=UPI002FFFCC78
MKFPEWYPFALIIVSGFSALLGGTWIIVQMWFHFQKRTLEIRKLKAETKRAELESKRAEIEVVNAGTNLRRGLYDIERSKMSLLESQNKLADRWDIPAATIRSEIFLDHPADDVKALTKKLLDAQ